MAAGARARGRHLPGVGRGRGNLSFAAANFFGSKNEAMVGWNSGHQQKFQIPSKEEEEDGVMVGASDSWHYSLFLKKKEEKKEKKRRESVGG